MSLPSASGYLDVFVGGHWDRRLAAAFFGALCSLRRTVFDVSGHVTGIDVTLRRGFRLPTQIVSASGEHISSFPSVYIYDPAASEQSCSVGGAFPSGRGFNADEILFPEGTYRLQFDTLSTNEAIRSTYPPIWYPSALTAHSARDVVLDRDLKGIEIVVPKGYRISGTAHRGGALVCAEVLDNGRVGTVSAAYANSTYDYRLVVAAGTYRVRSGDFCGGPGYYWKNASTFDAADPVVVNANVVVDFP